MKSEKISEEIERLNKLFENVDESKKELCSGLIEQAAYLAVEQNELKNVLVETGMIRYSPNNKCIQKPIEAAKQFRQNANSYANIIKTLNSVLGKNETEGDDPFANWLQDKYKEKSDK